MDYQKLDIKTFYKVGTKLNYNSFHALPETLRNIPHTDVITDLEVVGHHFREDDSRRELEISSVYHLVQFTIFGADYRDRYELYLIPEILLQNYVGV